MKTKELWEAFKKQGNRCLSIKRKNIRSHFTNLPGDGGTNSRNCWFSVKPYFECQNNQERSRYYFTERKEIIENKTDVADKQNDHFVYIVETQTGQKPRDLTCSSTGVVDETTISEIVERYKNH